MHGMGCATKAEKVFPHMSLLCREPNANVVPAAPLTRPLVIAWFQMKKNIPLPLVLSCPSPSPTPLRTVPGSLLCDWLHHHGIDPRHRRALS